MAIERLIVCQGTAQLVTAISALRTHMKRIGGDAGSTQSRDHLLICGLAVDESQTAEFSAVIEKMARLLHPFASISRLGDSVLKQLLGDARQASDATGIAALLEKATGIKNVAEVFTVRDWQDCNVLALCAYPDALHVCYGDSVGVYLPKGFMAIRRTLRSRVGTALRRWFSPRHVLDVDARLDVSYLLLPGAFGPVPGGEVVRTQEATLRQLFESLAPLLDVAAVNELRVRTKGRTVWVLMGSNFSEQGLMTLEAEVAAYRDWVSGLRPEPGTVLLIKSHPRDRLGKRRLVELQLQGMFSDVWSADDLGSAYLPMEVLLLHLKPVVSSLHTLTVSTACLATHFVVRSSNHIGFGDDLIIRHVAADRREERRQHERDLRRLCSS